jgi:CelD/BcsL family acetyltransferase involved in cellulose biosynthesis
VKICPEDLWESLARADDSSTFFQTPAWHHIAARHYKAESVPLLFEFPEDRGGAACLPLLRDKRWGRWRYFSPFGTYTAVVCPHKLEPREIQVIESVLASLNIHLISSPFTKNPVRAGRAIPARIQAIDLAALDPENIARNWDEDQRRRVRVAEREGLSVRVASSRADWDNCRTLYALSLQRWGSRTTVEYPPSLFGALRDTLAGHPGVKLWLVERGGAIGAYCVTLYHNRHAVAWSNAADARIFQSGGTQLLFREMIADALRGGFSIFDFGGSGGLSGVETFKGKFGTRVLGFDSYINSPGLIGALASLRDRFRGHG